MTESTFQMQPTCAGSLRGLGDSTFSRLRAGGAIKFSEEIGLSFALPKRVSDFTCVASFRNYSTSTPNFSQIWKCFYPSINIGGAVDEMYAVDEVNEL